MAFSLLLRVFSLAALAWSQSAAAMGVVPAVFVFGDSLADVGNNNYLDTASTSKADFPPNGLDFPGSIPTGRFCNGYNTIDWIAKLVGHNMSPPPFLSLKNGQLALNGVNFASGSSGILDTTGTNILTFTNQIDRYKTVVDNLKKRIGERKANNVLSRSLFIISAGSNDIIGHYLTSGPQNSTQNQNFTNKLVEQFGDELKTLYQYGARKFAILGISHIGCIPFLTSQKAGECVEDVNNLAVIFNAAAKAKLQSLSHTLPGMKYSYGNVYDLMTLAIDESEIFGYKEIKSACCGSGSMNGVNPCTLNASLCPNRHEYLFWDRYHPTQVAAKYTAISLYRGSMKFATPYNIQQLMLHF